MATRITHIIIPVKDIEALHRVRDFFVNVMGLHEIKNPKGKVRGLGAFPGGKLPFSDPPTKAESRMPTSAAHLFDDNNVLLDVVVFENKPVLYAEGTGSGEGVGLGFRVDDIKKTWKAATKDESVKPIFDPISYPDYVLEDLACSEAYFAFFAVDIDRRSADGPQQIIEITENKFLGGRQI